VSIKLKEKNFSVKANTDLKNSNKFLKLKPNIDHLIKRIINEKKKEKKKNLLFVITLLAISATTAVTLFN